MNQGKDVLGISVGSRNTVIGTYKNGVFKIILSDTSSRTIPTVISFNDKERNFGDIAFNQNRANFKSTIVYPNRWLGIKYNNSLKEEEEKYANLSPVKNLIDDSLGFKIDIKGEKIFHLPEVIMGSFFNKIKNVWLKQNIYTDQIVISIPDYCTVQERQAMLDSIYISGLNCLAILNESSAISINYAFQKLRELDVYNKRIVGFIDLGHSQLTIFFAEFTTKTINILAVCSERFCGARDLDYLIAEKISYEFQKKTGIDLLDNPKAKISLINTINKIRKTLTVNKEGTISIDEIVKGEDLFYNLTRENMENIITPVLQKFENLCKMSLKKLEKLGIYLKNLHSIEMVGDTLRTPCFLKIINNVFQKDLSKTLIPDECIPRGCALFAMMNSPYYNLQNFLIHHYNPYPIIMEYPDINDGKIFNNYINIFEEGENIPNIKKVSLKRKELEIMNDIQIKIMYKDIQELNYFKDKLIQEYIIHFPPGNYSEAELEFELNINCIPKLTKVTFINKNYNQIMNNNGNIKFELINQNFGIHKEYLDIYHNEEMGRDEKDLIMKDIIAYKNSIEEYIYKMRENINSDKLKEHFSQKEKDDLILEMDNLMEWLYSNDEGLYNINTLEEKSKKMKNLGDLFFSRLNGWEDIKQLLGKMETLLFEKLADFTSMEDEIKNGNKSELTLNDINKIKEYIQKEFNNYEGKMYEIEIADKSKVPKMTVNDIQNMIDSFNNNIEKMKNKINI